jgi:hypothetical protein
VWLMRFARPGAALLGLGVLLELGMWLKLGVWLEWGNVAGVVCGGFRS